MGFRAKLIFSYAIVISVTLLLGMALFAIIFGQIQDEASRKAIGRLQNVSNKVSEFIATDLPPLLNRSLPEYQRFVQSYSKLLDVRIMLVDENGLVKVDSEAESDDSMLNQTIPNYKLVPRDGKSYDNRVRLQGVPYFYYARSGPNVGSTAAETSGRRVALRAEVNQQTFVKTDLWVAVKEETLNAGWNNFLTGMLGAATLALAVSIALALLIARSITRPLIRMTRASVEIAQGNYSQQLKIEGHDEMGRLAASFNQMARAVDSSQKTMRDFVANVSHELKTPLTSIQGFSQAMVEGVADDRESLHHSAMVIHNEAARMRRLVDELLDLSRIESGQIELNRRELDLGQLLARVVDKLEPQADRKGLVIQHRLELVQGLKVSGDADRLEQIFTNILDNALKYSCEGGLVWLDVQTAPPPAITAGEAPADAGRLPRQAQPARVNIAIGNTGSIIPAEQLPRIFERFYKLDRSRKRKGESTGLGLSIAKELVEAHQGSLSVVSQPHPAGQELPGEGFTIFTVRLPVISSSLPLLAGPAGLLKGK